MDSLPVRIQRVIEILGVGVHTTDIEIVLAGMFRGAINTTPTTPDLTTRIFPNVERDRLTMSKLSIRIKCTTLDGHDHAITFVPVFLYGANRVVYAGYIYVELGPETTSDPALEYRVPVPVPIVFYLQVGKDGVYTVIPEHELPTETCDEECRELCCLKPHNMIATYLTEELVGVIGKFKRPIIHEQTIAIAPIKLNKKATYSSAVLNMRVCDDAVRGYERVMQSPMTAVYRVSMKYEAEQMQGYVQGQFSTGGPRDPTIEMRLIEELKVQLHTQLNRDYKIMNMEFDRRLQDAYNNGYRAGLEIGSDNASSKFVEYYNRGYRDCENRTKRSD